MSRDWNALGVTHRFLAEHVKPGSFAVDATAGNGGDTAFLCRLVGEKGRVLAMDIQPQAVENTRARLLAEGFADIGQVLLADHARLGQLVPPESADCIVFNFGWLPGGDHEVFTRKETSVPAVRQALEQGELTWEQLETACLRVLQAKLKLGILSMEPQDKNE